MLEKLTRPQVKIEEDEVRKAFDAMYGEKVQCRMIIWPKGQERIATQVYDKIRSSEAEFASAARQQATSLLAQSGGRFDPIGHGGGDDPLIEKIAFGLKKDELSELFEIPNVGVAVMKRDNTLPPDTTKSFEQEKDFIHRRVFSKKVEWMIPQVMKKLQDEAKPLILLKYGTSDRDVIKAAEEELGLTHPASKPGAPRSAVPLPQK